MDKQTLIISQGMQDLIAQNKETNAQLKKLNKPSSLGESTTENLGEILAGLTASRMEIKAQSKLVDNAKREFGTTEKGIDYTDAGTPSGVPKGTQTLYGITKAFYGKFNFGNLVNSTESVSKSVIDLRSQEKKNQDKENKVSQKAKDAFGKSEKKSTNFMTTIKRFIKDRNVFKKKKINQMNFMGGLKKGSGFTKASRGLSKKAEGGFGAKKLIKLAGKFFAPLRIGMAVGKVLTLPFRLLGKGIGMLTSAVMVPLKFIGKGIMAIPKKIFGFLGGAFSILSKIAMLGVGILALSKLSQFLRNTTPEDRKKFVDGMVKNTIKLKDAIGELGDFITLKFIPFMTDVMYGFLDSGIVKFFFSKYYSPELKALLVKRRSDAMLQEGAEVTLNNIKVQRIIDETTDPRHSCIKGKKVFKDPRRY